MSEERVSYHVTIVARGISNMTSSFSWCYPIDAVKDHEKILDAFSVDPEAIREARTAFEREYKEIHIPSALKTFEIRMTLQCTNKCQHCFISARPKESQKTAVEMKEIIDTLSEPHRITLTGGEPTIHPGFLDVLAYCKANKHEVLLQTHGRTLADKNFANNVLPMLDKMLVPIHSFDEQIFDNITRVPGSFSETVRGLDNAYAANIDFDTQTVLNVYNYKTLAKTLSFIQERWPGRSMTITFPVTFPHIKHLIPTFTEVKPYLQEAVKLHASKIRSHYFPHCMLYPYHDKIEELIDEREYLRGDHPGLDLLDGEWKKVEYSDEVKRQSTKGPDCYLCRFNKRCRGVFKTYVELHSFDLLPVLP